MEMTEPLRITDAQLDSFLAALDASGLERLRDRFISPEARRFMDICTYQVNDLLEALRRDLRTEELKAMTDPENAFFHHLNVRQVKSLLEMINPKSPALPVL
jgi:hypothetical protein